METLVGIFSSRSAAEDAVRGLHEIGLSHEAIVFVTPDAATQELQSIPTTDAEPRGIGETLSSYLGGVIGGSVGLGAGSAIASLLVPGVGTVFAIGIGAAALLGAGGAVAGAAIGEATEKAMDEGVPRDDVLFYRALLNRGRSIVTASVETDELAGAARAVLHNYGAPKTSMLHDENGTPAASIRPPDAQHSPVCRERISPCIWHPC
jgi:hypothetical protein